MFKTVRGAVNINYWWTPYVYNCEEELLTYITDGHLMFKTVRVTVNINY